MTKLWIFKFYAIGNGGMECFTTHRVYPYDIRKAHKNNLEDMIDGILGGSYSEGVRSIHCKLVRPSRKLVKELFEDKVSDVEKAERNLKADKRMLEVMSKEWYLYA